MKKALVALLAALGIIGTANTATAGGTTPAPTPTPTTTTVTTTPLGTSATSAVNGTGSQFNGQVQASLPGQTVTLGISGSNGVVSPPTVTQTPNTNAPGTGTTSASVSLSLGAALGGGFGNTSGLTNTQLGAVPTTGAPVTPATLSGAAHANGIAGF